MFFKYCYVIPSIYSFRVCRKQRDIEITHRRNHFTVRSSCRDVFYEKRFVKFPKTDRKAPVPKFLLNKVACLEPASILKKRFLPRCFPVNFVKFLSTVFSPATDGHCKVIIPVIHFSVGILDHFLSSSCFKNSFEKLPQKYG